jgi:hypothetical protein
MSARVSAFRFRLGRVVAGAIGAVAITRWAAAFATVQAAPSRHNGCSQTRRFLLKGAQPLDSDAEKNYNFDCAA